MKKTFTLLSLLVGLSLLSSAQPTITTAQLPVAGLAWTTANDTNYVAAVLPGGANVTWDYTGLVNQFLDTLGFQSAAGTPYAGSFPASNLAAFDAPNATWGYYTANNTGFYEDGFVDPSGSVFAVNPPSLFTPVPFTYGNTRSSNTGFSIDTLFGGQNLRIELDVNTDFLADGYGTLLLPTGTQNDVLRIKLTDLSTTTISVEALPGSGIYIPVQTTQSQSTTYRYFNQSQASFILEIEADSLGTTAFSSAYLVQSVILDAPSLPASASTAPYPNPADNILTFPELDNGIRNITLWGMDGRNHVMPLSGTGRDKQLETRTLSEGLYFYRAGMTVGKFVVKH